MTNGNPWCKLPSVKRVLRSDASALAVSRFGPPLGDRCRPTGSVGAASPQAFIAIWASSQEICFMRFRVGNHIDANRRNVSRGRLNGGGQPSGYRHANVIKASWE
jgi:hypothetical protein